jgi:hypothetical protein
MARMPGAVWRPMPGSSTTPMKSYDVLCFHTMVGSLAGTDSYFRSSASGTNSHFGVGGDGTIYQWVDTAYRSGASLNGNYHLISVETADMGPEFPAWSGSNVPAWTDAQIAANARITAWVHATHGIPLTQIPDALPTRRGVGYHRLGVPGYMVPGAEQWSTATGKVCPGDRRISQVPQVIAAASGGVSFGGFLMALTDAQQVQVYTALMEAAGSTGRNNFSWLADQIVPKLAAIEGRMIKDPGGPADRERDLWEAIQALRDEVKALADRLPTSP